MQGFHRLQALLPARSAIVWTLGLLSLFCLGLIPTLSRADQVIAEAASPDHNLKLKLSLNGDGKLSYEIIRKDQLLIAPSRLGLLLSNAKPFDGQFVLDHTETASHDETWEQPWGERRFVRNHYNELMVELKQPFYNNHHLILRFRLFDDGLGFRYEFPKQADLSQIKILAEQTEFNIVPESKAWWNVGGEWDNLEYLYQETPLRELSLANTPLTLKTKDNSYITLHEAALTDYASMWIRRVDGQILKAQLTPASQGPAVVLDTPSQTPWRTLIITDAAKDLYNSNIELNLNEPNRLGDVSWIKPSKFIGVWWEMHLGKSSWSSGPNHGATTANTKNYIDFAAKHGFRGVLVEGWNQGWDGHWFGNGAEFSFTTPYPDFDIKALSAYGLKKGVHLIGHHETGGNIAHYERQMDQGFALYSALGIDAVKTGYVTDGGTLQFGNETTDVHFGYSDSQEGARHFTKVLETAAKYKIAIDSHEPIKDTGLRRTYPNWVSREGARGQEYNAWGNPPNPPEHEANLVFTRMLAGPMDFTPGVLSLEGNHKPIASTQAKQLALYVVLYSPVQMAADLPENYMKYPKAFQFIKDVPTDWAESQMLQGEPGDFAVIARKDRHSENWFLGGISDDQSRPLDTDLSFLDPKKTYVAEIYRDGPKASAYGEGRFDLVIESRRVTAKDHISLMMSGGGGVAIAFKPSSKKP